MTSNPLSHYYWYKLISSLVTYLQQHLITCSLIVHVAKTTLEQTLCLKTDECLFFQAYLDPKAPFPFALLLFDAKWNQI